ncbi:MAG TPA: hypothetical protein DHV48_03695 [Prolixibacteraceae bacterium]|nr:hypothetical protein [Prolixibacteraceae bacterium]
MNERDLRTGNIVGFVLPDQPVIVSEILKYNDEYFLETLTIDGETGNAGRPIDDFEPIPLTEEWRIKCGLIKDGELTYTHKDLEGQMVYFDIAQNAYFNDVNVCGDFDQCVFIKMPEFVHTLQNWWPLLTGKELEIKL